MTTAAGTGCKHGSSGRLLGTYGYADGHVQSTGQPDFSEEEVWLASSSSSDSDPNEKWPESTPDRIYSNYGSPNDRCRVGPLSSALDGARNDRRSVGGLSLALAGRHNAGSAMIRQHRLVDRSGNRHVAAASAPINVPVWSKLVRVDSTDPASSTFGLARDESEWVPPHEYLEREYGKNATTSVVEGMGRTLKGRDMSQVRDAVWSQTGFFG